MRVPDEHPLRLTHALLNPATAVAAAEALRGRRGKTEVEGLVELLYQPPSARAALAAIEGLQGCGEPIVLDALAAAVDSPQAPVRIVAIQSLHARGATGADDRLRRALEQDESWLVRRAALRALADRSVPDRWCILTAATDPHWRLRHALIQALLGWGETEEQRQEIEERLTRAGADPRALGVRGYLHYRWTGAAPANRPKADAEDPVWSSPFWDWDAAVLARNLERLGAAGRRQALDVMPSLLAHGDPRVRAWAVDTLRNGETRHFAQVLRLLDDPRNGVGESVAKLLSYLDLDRAEALARFVLHAGAGWAGHSCPAEAARAGMPVPPGLWAGHSCPAGPSPAQLAWAVDQAGVAFPPHEEQAALEGLMRQAAVQPVRVRRALARLASRWDHPDAGRWLDDLGSEASAINPRMLADDHPHVRAAALTPERAAELVQGPTRETSWHVLAKAARLARVPLWDLAPANPWRPPQGPAGATGGLQVRPTVLSSWRPLGPEGLVVSPMGVSGHYGLPVEGFIRALEAGVNLLFWEPNYQTLTEFAGRLSAADRRSLHFLTGTFEADGAKVRRDAERALRMLQIDRLAIFLLFWVQSWQRVTPDVREALERLKEEGKIATFGLSTHSRPLAVEAMASGWGPVMVRHSAAHRGAEERVFPRALELGTSILTFNNTCYGRLLQAHGGSPPGAADCYRYTLAQPAVRACWSAPATLEQLEENLEALRDPELPEERRQRLRAHGDRVYQEDATFRAFVRSL